MESNPCEALDLSAIDSQSAVGSAQIQEMGLDEVDEADFRANVRELLFTENLGPGSSGGEQHSGQEDWGQPLKGSFLREMEILGKTLSFESTLYDIYEQCPPGQKHESEISKSQQQQMIAFQGLSKFIKQFRKEQTSKAIQSKYVIDFQKLANKHHKNPKSRAHNSKAKKQAKSIPTDSAFSTYSLHSANNLGANDRVSRKQAKLRKKCSQKNMSEIKTLALRKSDMSDYKGKNMKSPLKKFSINMVEPSKRLNKTKVLNQEEKKKSLKERIGKK